MAERSILIKNMLEDLGDADTDEAIPIPNVRNAIIFFVSVNLAELPY